jgi:hypothetical protein
VDFLIYECHLRCEAAREEIGGARTRRGLRFLVQGSFPGGSGLQGTNLSEFQFMAASA